MEVQDAPVFEALIFPYRSLSSGGVRRIVGGLAFVTAVFVLRFCLLGAWPVAAFSVLEVPLLFVLLAINQRRARASELIMLDTMRLTVIRTDPSGKRMNVSLPAAWLRVDLDTAKGASRLMVSSHGRVCEVGAFLHESAKTSLFDALGSALHRIRNPRFDNPHLRGD